MKLLSTIGNYAKNIISIGPLKKVYELASSLVNKVTFGRGLKIWSKPALKEVKAKEDFSEFELANGMKVIFKQSKGNEVNATLTIGSGADKVPKGKEGLAHFLEHIVVQNTKQFGDDINDVARLNGGYVNAYTSNKETVYPLTLPKDKLDLSLRMLRAYMTELDYDDKILEKEKGIVCSEMKMSEANAARKAFVDFQEALFGKGHPLTNDPIGTSEAVQSYTKADVDAFYQSEYVPNNATLTISGEFNKAEMKRLIARYFGDIPANPNLETPDYGQTIQSSEQRHYEFKDDTLVSSLKHVYHIPRFNHKDNLIADLVQEALTGGRDSRLVKKLEDGEANNGKPVVLRVVASDDTTKDYGHFYITAKPLDENKEHNFQVIEKVIDEELQDIAQNGLQDKEFKRLIVMLENAEIYKKDSQHADLGKVTGYFDEGEDWAKSLDYLKDLKQITNEDIKNFVAKYLVKENRHTLKIVGSGKGFDADFKKSLEDKVPEVNKNEDKAGMNAEKLDRVKSLSGGISKLTTELTDLQKIQLDNGMQVFLKEDHSLPVVFAKARFEGGSLSVSDDLERALAMLDGILGATGSYNPKTKRRFNKQDLENLKISLGTSFSVGTGSDSGAVSFTALRKNYSKSLALMNEVINNPAILSDDPEVKKEVEQEFDKLKKAALDIHEIFKKFPALKAQEKFSRAMYPKGHKFYQRGYEEGKKILQNIKLEDLRNLYKQLYHAKGAKVSVTGDINQQEVEGSLVKVLENWNKDYHGSQRAVDYSKIAAVDAPKSSISVVASENNEPQSTVIIGNPAEVSYESPDYFPSVIANSILGQGMSSRLFTEVRERLGLVYHINSSLMAPRKGCGPFSITYGCDPRNIKKSLAGTLAAVNKFLKQGINPQELEMEKAEVKKSFALHALKNRRITNGTLSKLQRDNRDEAFINNFNKMIDAITVEQVNEVARKFIKPENFTIVVTKPKDFKMPQEPKVQPKKETNQPAQKQPMVLAV